MENISNLLVVIDPTVERDFVVDRAKSLAKKFQCKVTLFVNNSKSPTRGVLHYKGVDKKIFEQQKAHFVEQNESVLLKVKVEFEELGIDVVTDFREESHLAESIIDKAREISADLTIKSTHRHSTIQRTLMTNTDWRLIRKCPSPLYLVKPGQWKEHGSVLASVDPFHVKSEQNSLDHLILSTTELFAQQLQQRPRVFHCYLPFMGSMFPTAVEFDEHLKEIRNRHQEKLLELLSNHDIPVEDIEIDRGDLVPSLIKMVTKTDTNLLVIGALSRNFIERAIVGNSAEKILEDILCDVLIVKRAPG